jgi:virginiamycin B lyase
MKAAKVSFSPNISTNAGGGTNPSTLVARLTGCTTSDARVSITRGTVSGTFTSSPVSCSPVGATDVTGSFTIAWIGKFNGAVGPTTYGGSATFTSTTLALSGESLQPDGFGNEGLAVTDSQGSSTGSFPGSTAWSVYSKHVTAALLAAECAKSVGLSQLPMPTGTISVGVSDPNFSFYPDPSLSYPGSITTGPDGALWFTNFFNNTIGRIATDGTVTNYSDPSITNPTSITVGPDGALWFTDSYGATLPLYSHTIGRITTGGVVTSFTDPSISDAGSITAGPDGALWFVEGNTIGRITTGGSVTTYSDPSISGAESITAGPDGALWFTNNFNGNIGRITTNGSVTSYSDPSISGATSITAGPDGALWFTGGNGVTTSIGRITTGGAVTTFSDPSISNANSITTGPDGALWFTEDTTIGRITTGGSVTTYSDPPFIVTGSITAGPDGALWFTNVDDHNNNNTFSYIGRYAP